MLFRSCDAVAIDIGVAQYQVSSKENPDDYTILNDIEDNSLNDSCGGSWPFF